MSLSKGLSRLHERVHQTGGKVKKTITRLFSSSSVKKNTRERNKLRKIRKTTGSSKDQSSTTHPPALDDNKPETAPTVNVSPHDASVESENPYDRVAHHLCQALVDHIRAHYGSPSPACSCSAYSTSECDHCQSDSPTSHTGATSMTDQQNEDVISSTESYYNRSPCRKETKHKKSTAAPRVLLPQVHPSPHSALSIPRILASQVPLSLPRPRPLREPAVPNPATFHTAMMRQSGLGPDQRIPVTEFFYRATQYEYPHAEHDDEYDYANIRAHVRFPPPPERELYDTRIFAWLRELPEQQHPLRRKPKLDNMSSPSGSQEAGLGTITE